ncbi:winged helix-turn-helix domain-containing protein [Psychrobium sp. nBUS_13]|uniref:winged helix-turn-helix domain-containing protein n=1 Tax=Psychrobium sp. nBUS_13 TaxID=3395319 RepID=UPI003EB7CD60
MLQQDKSIQINQWVFSYAESSLIKAGHEQLLDETLESVSLNQHTLDVLWQLVKAYPDVISADQILDNLSDQTMSRNKLYQSIAKLRRVFDDKTHDAQYIETVPRQGYRWLAKPCERRNEQQVIEEQNKAIVNDTNDSEEEPQVHSGVLEQNIFDDLGFISDVQEQESLDTSNVEESSQADDTGVETTSIDGSTNDDSTRNKEESIVNTPEQDEVSHHAQSSIEPTSDTKSISNKWKWVIAFLLMLILSFVGTRYFKSEPKAVFVPSDVLYVAPLTVKGAVDTLSQDGKQRIQWWLDQKLQHLPAIQVMPYRDDNALPRVQGVIDVIDEGVKLELHVLTKQNIQKPALISLFLSDSISQNIVQNDAFNQSLAKHITGVESALLVTDKCHISDFIGEAVQTEDCLVALNNKFHHLLTKLHATELTDTEEIISASDLDVFAKQIIKRYPEHSLGYEVQASYYNYIGAINKAHDALLKAMERNQNSTQIIKLLSESYRKLKDFNRSIVLVDALIERRFELSASYYWQAYDLVALGNLEKAQLLIEEHAIELSSIEQQVYFFGVNYNQLQTFLNNEQPKTAKTINFIEQAISNDNYCISLQSVTDCVQLAADKISAQYRMTQWQAAALYLKANDPMQAINVLSNEDWLNNEDISLASGADRLFYIPTYANILMKTGQEKEGLALLKHFIVFVKSSGLQKLYALPLAEAYALVGQQNDALKQMAQLLASGWLPSPKYQMWPLQENPNLDSINRQWQFLNLLELIENRRQLIRLRVKDLKKAQ